MADQSALETVAKARYVSLTTFRKSGDPVSTPMWIAQDSDGALVISTHADSWKVKRLRNDPRVELRPSSARGVVKPDAVTLAGTAELLFDEAKRDHVVALLRRKYGVQQRLLAWLESVRGSESTQRVILKITPN
jgi:PPOX class probable F420-dependent enzyme